MKLYLLRPAAHLKSSADDPWNPWYDKAFGFVVRAETEDEARRLANEEAGDESCGTIAPWLDPAYSACEELTANGPSEVVLRDFNAA